MANITIPNLPQAVSIDGTEQLLGVQSGTSKSITTGQIVSLATGGGGTTPLVVAAGGTGNTTFDTYGVLYGDGTNPVESITPPTGSNYILVASPGTVPAWQENIPVTAGVNSISFGSTGLTPNTATEGVVTVAGTLATANGGTNLTSFTSGGAVYATSTTALTTGTLPTASGGTNLTSFTANGAVYATSTSALTTGTLPAISGGTGQSSFAVGDLLYSDTTTTLAKLADVATGSVLISGGVGVAPSYSASPTLTTSLTTPLLIGGTTASSTLTLQSTSGAGTTDKILFKVGNNGAFTAGTIGTTGNWGFGGNATTFIGLAVPLDITGATSAYGQRINGNVQSDVTTLAAAYFSNIALANASFTTTDLVHFLANPPSGGAGSTATNQYGFKANSTLGSNGAATVTNSYGFYSDLASATNKYNFYANGTADNYFGGNVGIGTTSLTNVSLRVSKNITGSTSAYGIFSDGEIQPSVTSSAIYFGTDALATSGTITNLIHYRANQSTLGTATVSTQYGFQSDNGMIGATNNYAFNASNTAAVTAGKTAYGFRADIDIATGGGTTYQFYAAGTAPSVINGTVTLGTPLAVSSGGTGATTSNAALTNLTTFTSTATASGTTVLTNTSTYFQFFTGTLTQTITLPVTSTLGTGWSFHIVNNSTGNLTVNSSGGNLVITVLPGLTVMVTCIGTALTTAADWEAGYTDFTTATGTGSVVLSASPTLTGTTTATTLSATTLTATAGAGFQNMEVLTSGASWSLPAALQVTGAKFKITVIGGGGGGGGNAATAATSGAGGGGGGLCVAYLNYVSGQNSVTTSFGAAGAGASNTAGTAGGATTATYNSLTYIGTGGSGGAIGTPAAGGAGGTGTTGTGTETFALSGQNGGNAGTTTAAAGVTYIDNSGGGVGLGWGNGGRMPFAGAAGIGGTVGTGYGGGGSGSTAGSTATARAGGNGTAGAIIVEY